MNSKAIFMPPIEDVLKTAYEIGKSAGQKNVLSAFLSDDPEIVLGALRRMPRDKALAVARANRSKLDRMYVDAERDYANIKHKMDGLNDLMDWFQKPGHTLTRCESTSWHKVISAHRMGALDFRCGASKEFAEETFLRSVPQIVLVQHNWASAFSNAEDIDVGEVRDPFDITAFEMCVSGRRIIEVHANGHHCWVIKMLGRQWSYFGPPFSERTTNENSSVYPITRLVQENVRAACIALDAEVATTVVTRAPHKLNRAREKRGEPPVLDFHTVALAHRKRYAPLLSGSGHHRSPRLHFRRGHWRHYDQHKTWIRWTLVGDPDLGFIDKEYRI